MVSENAEVNFILNPYFSPENEIFGPYSLLDNLQNEMAQIHFYHIQLLFPM